jgi:beta-galactosidase
MVHIAGKRYAQRAGETTEVRVYSNQPTVELSLNGKVVEEKSADKVFVFTVALEEGFNILTAKAGEVKDTATLEKVEKEPEIYVLPEVNERAEGVANWFSQVGDLDLKAPMQFPEGKYSIRNTFEELAKSPEAIEIASKAVKLTMNMVVTPGEGMWDMMKSMSLESVASLSGDLCPEGFIESINAKLIEIDIVE